MIELINIMNNRYKSWRLIRIGIFSYFVDREMASANLRKRGILYAITSFKYLEKRPNVNCLFFNSQWKASVYT